MSDFQRNKKIPSFKFLVATDVHLGHQQNHLIRKNDSFNAFEEVLSIAIDQQVDFLLLGGDLFDQVNPSQKTIYKCLNMLQYYVQGEGKKNIHATMLNNDEMKINFQNKNINIKLPIFTIHGNHDYPSNDFGKLSICDLLHVSNYANYFGKHTSLSFIQIDPIIIQKQNIKTKIAIYGLGYIKDNVLNQLFEEKKVKFKQLQNKDDYFCIFIFHQNRYKKGLRPGAPALKCISSKHIPAWMDLTIWGHQHEAISKIEIQDQRKIFQPGSTVITSFIQAQSFPKQTLLVDIANDGNINIHPIPLTKSYRPMICKSYQSSELVKGDPEFDIYNFLDNEIKTMIQNISQQFGDRKPIIRLKVQYSECEISKCKGLQSKYSQKVANPQSVITFWKRKQAKAKDDKQIMQAFRQKANLKDDHKQITQQILIKFTKKQENQNLYYDPRDILKYTQFSIQKQLIHWKQHATTFFSKQMEKKYKPEHKQIESLYKNYVKELDTRKRQLIQDTQNNINKQYSSSSSTISIPSERISFQNQKKIMLLKQNQVNTLNVYKNFGSNLVPQQKKQSMNQIRERQLSGRSTVSNIHTAQNNQRNSLGLNNTNTNKKNTNQQKKQMSQQISNMNKRPGILKKANIQLSDCSSQLHNSEEEQQDCCKKAQKTEYNQSRTKQIFKESHKRVQQTTKNKKKEQLPNNKKKSVRFSQQEDI